MLAGQLNVHSSKACTCHRQEWQNACMCETIEWKLWGAMAGQYILCRLQYEYDTTLIWVDENNNILANFMGIFQILSANADLKN